MADLIDVPPDMTVKDIIIMKRLQNDYFAEVRLVMRNGQYEAALFLNDRFKPGPPIPQPLDNPSGDLTHWMGVRPSVGLTTEEAERILDEVSSENAIHHKKMNERWGKNNDY